MQSQILRAAALASMLLLLAAVPALADDAEGTEAVASTEAVAPGEASVVVDVDPSDPTVVIDLSSPVDDRAVIYDFVAHLDAVLTLPEGVEWTGLPVDFVILDPDGVEWTFSRRSWAPEESTGGAEEPETEVTTQLGVEWTK